MAHRHTPRGEKWARRGGFLLGLALVPLALAGWRIPDGADAVAGADVVFSAGPTGELAVSPAGPFLAARALTPSARAARGRLAVTNQTGRPLAVRVRALPEADDLDRVLRVWVRAGGSTLFRGELAGLRRWTRHFALAPGEQGSLELDAWLPATARSGYAGRIESVPLEFHSTPVGSGG